MRAVVRTALLVVLATAALTLRMIIGGETEFAASTEALIAGDVRSAIRSAQTSAEYYAPGAPHVDAAYTRLLAIGREAEARKLDEEALLAFGAVRSACLSTRWIALANAQAFEEANRSIASLQARAPPPPGLTSDPPAQLAKEAVARFSTQPANRLPIHLSLAGAFASMVAGLSMILRATSATGQVNWRRGKLGALLGIAGVAAWLIVLALA